MKTLELEEILLLPVHRNPLKRDKKQTPAKQRMEMLRLAVKNEENFAISDIEIARGGASYAVDTLQELTYLHNDEYWFIVGSDAIREIEQWKAPEKLVRLCRFGVTMRAGQDPSQLLAVLPESVQEVVDWVEMTPFDMSSSEIRRRVTDRRPVAQWLHPDVMRYIEEHKLYRS
jgi:nicotinate-nucleotide adenylyltransferase